MIELLCGKIQACEAEVEKIKALGNCRGLCVYVPGRSLLNIRCFGRAGSSSGYELDPCSARKNVASPRTFNSTPESPTRAKRSIRYTLYAAKLALPTGGLDLIDSTL